MEIRADATLLLPRDVVFAGYRDRLAEVADRLPNIRSIQVVSRRDREGEVDLVNEWVGGGDIPKAARAFLDESMLKWTDRATWKEVEFAVEWRTEVHAFPKAISSSGKNRFVEVPEGTRFELRGNLTVDASKVPGVPRLLASTVNGAIEKLFVGQIQVNSVAVANAVAKLLEAGR